MSAVAGLWNGSPAAEKIARFRSLFLGRDDVYARRFEMNGPGRSLALPSFREKRYCQTSRNPE